MGTGCFWGFKKQCIVRSSRAMTLMVLCPPLTTKMRTDIYLLKDKSSCFLTGKKKERYEFPLPIFHTDEERSFLTVEFPIHALFLDKKELASLDEVTGEVQW